MVTPFSELGDAIERAYAAEAYKPEAFATIAAEALARARLHTRLGAEDVYHWLASVDALPPQNVASRFGDAPLTVYATDRWGIEVLSWLEGRTTIHAHDFAGAFTVLEGESIQRRYDFTPTGVGERALRTGVLHRKDLTLLPRGAVEPILAGDGLIHSVFHLARPTVSVVVRTDALHLDTPQYDYQAPHVAVDPEHVDAVALRQRQALAMLLRTGNPGAAAYATRLLTRADLHGTFRLLDMALGVDDGGVMFRRLVALAERRHGEAVDAMVASLRQAHWEHAVFERLRSVAAPELRFLLGALLSASGRDDVTSLVAARWPTRDAAYTVRAWIRVLVGADAGDEVGDATADVVEMLREGRAVDEAAAVLARRRDAGRLVARVGAIDAFCEGIRGGVLRPWFVAGSGSPRRAGGQPDDDVSSGS